jgi:cytochrome P450
VDIDDFELEQRGPGLLPDIDNPRHDQLRKVVQRSFMPRSIRALTDDICTVCNRLIDDFGDRREVDIADELAWPIPFQVFFDFLGMPQGEIREKFIHWTHGIKDREIGSPDLTPLARESTHELRAYLAELLRDRRRSPREDVLTTIVQAEIEGVPLAPEDIDAAAEAVGLVFALYIAGIETTAGQISTLLEQLARYPEQQRAIREDLTLIPRAVEESLRFRSIFQVTARTTARPVRVHDVEIPEGKRVFLILGSANLDETKFDDPERFDVQRPPAPHLAFGEGLHGCLGNPLARLEATVALEQLIARRGVFTLDGEPRRYTTTPNGYVLDRVPVAFD